MRALSPPLEPSPRCDHFSVARRADPALTRGPQEGPLVGASASIGAEGLEPRTTVWRPPQYRDLQGVRRSAVPLFGPTRTIRLLRDVLTLPSTSLPDAREENALRRSVDCSPTLARKAGRRVLEREADPLVSPCRGRLVCRCRWRARFRADSRSLRPRSPFFGRPRSPLRRGT